MDAAGSLGAGLTRHFGWTVQLKNPILEVLLMTVGDAMTIALALNQESKYKRNVTCYPKIYDCSFEVHAIIRMNIVHVSVYLICIILGEACI